MKISRYIFFAFLFILLLFSITTFINFRLSEAIDENAAYVSRSTEITKNGGRFQRNMLDMVSGLRGYLLTGEKYFVDSYDSAVAENENILLDLSSVITDSSQAKLINEIQALNNEWVDEYAEPLRQAKKFANVNDSNLASFNKLYRDRFLTGDEREIQRKLQQKFRAFTIPEYQERTKKIALLTASVRSTKTLSFTLTILSIVIGFIVVGFLVRLISKRISGMVNMANTIAEGNYGAQVTDSGDDELTALVRSLNHMSAELSKNISLLESKNTELDQFAHIVSHDLKGPLRGIDNVISWIEEDHKEELSPKVAEYVQLIKGRVSRAENLIQGLLSYARTGREEMEKENVDVNVLVNEVLENLPVNGHINIRSEKLPEIFTEKILLFQVFSNLVSNSIKYNDKNQGNIRIYCKEHPSKYEFFVQDDGPGISKVYHKRIFDIFQTLKERDSFESTGVGLAIVKKILDKKNETVRVVSEPGSGATFSFTWPKQ